MKYLRRFSYTITFLLLFFLWVLFRPDGPEQIYQLQGETMGTSYRIQIVGFPEEVGDEELADSIEQRLYRLDRELMSVYANDSELSRFNDMVPGDWFPVSEELATVMAEALAVSRLTEGYFDVTVGPLIQRWGFARRAARSADRVPSADEVEELLGSIGYQALEVRTDPPALRKTAPVSVDLGGIAKGYGTDVIADFFDSLGMESYFIEIGGELRIRGVKPDGSSWVPAMERPSNTAPQVYEIFYSHGQSIGVAGSGDYRNFFEQGGQRYSHEIDPFTGRPVTHQLAAVYVIADTAMRADALSTAFMVMGEQKAYTLAEEMGIAAFFIIREPESEGFREIVTTAFVPYLEERP